MTLSHRCEALLKAPMMSKAKKLCSEEELRRTSVCKDANAVVKVRRCVLSSLANVELMVVVDEGGDSD